LHLVARGGERLAGLERDAAGEIEGVAFNTMRDVLKNGGAAPCGEDFRLGKGIFGSAQGLVSITAGGLTDGGDDVVVIRAAHFGGGFAVAMIARNDEGCRGRRTLGGSPFRFGDWHRLYGSGRAAANEPFAATGI
jgi:hypothetical protein